MIDFKHFQKISPYLWEISKDFRKDMRVPARIYVSEQMLKSVLEEKAVEQLINISTLPGIEKFAIAMPDIHQGYGFPIGGVAAIRTEDGVISPGGVGYDINCGVRLLASEVVFDDIKIQLEALIGQIQRDVPSGVGRGGQLVLQGQEFDKVLNSGVAWAESRGYALPEDTEVTEERGNFEPADAEMVSPRAKKRGSDQLGTLGAGNHFVEVQEVVEILDKDIAEAFGLFKGQVTIMVHTGSRGIGHQICTDYVQLMNKVVHKYNIEIPDRELACAPFLSEEGQQYYGAMAAGANFAWVNRQLMTFHIRKAWARIFETGKANPLKLVYDVAHNMAKQEKHDGVDYIVHRKGATRAFGPGSPDLPEQYQATGQPVIIPGSMGTHSYVLAGTKQSMSETFGSTCHGAGRRMSRTKAKKSLDYNTLRDMLDKYGVVVRAGSAKGLLEEAPEAYKDIDEVIEVVSEAGIANKVAKMKPVGIMKG
ncbi:RtcB family protein [Patescibacteria group bacterium]